MPDVSGTLIKVLFSNSCGLGRQNSLWLVGPETQMDSDRTTVTKLADVVKDTKTYLVSGLIIIVAWMLLVDTYVEHRGDNLLEKELVAYVLIKDALKANKASIYAEYTDFSGEPHDTFVPALPPGYVFRESVPDDDAIETCVSTHWEEVGGAPAMRNSYDTRCRVLTVTSPEQGNEKIRLLFVRQGVPESDTIKGYYLVQATDSGIPFGHYGVVLVRDSHVQDLRKRPESGSLDPKTYLENGPTQSHETFERLFKFCVIRQDKAAAFQYSAGDEEGNLADSLQRIVSGDRPETAIARQPIGWSRLQDKLRLRYPEAMSLDDIQVSTPNFQKLMSESTSENAVYEFGSIKVPLSLAPWAAALLLVIFSCLLVGTYASMRYPGAKSQQEDFGWLFLQDWQSLGGALRFAAATLVALVAGLILYAFVTTCIALRHLDFHARLPVIVLLAAMLAFAIIASLNVFWQRRTASKAKSTFKS